MTELEGRNEWMQESKEISKKAHRGGEGRRKEGGKEQERLELMTVEGGLGGNRGQMEGR